MDKTFYGLYIWGDNKKEVKVKRDTSAHASRQFIQEKKKKKRLFARVAISQS